ncbi:MAG: FxLYD domain-containing protein [Deltaproteobacteria bacterium]|nr:FxLYD domain-containing protein [Deltaproteobacteria bacterium]
MALKVCKECGKEVSTEAEKCPNCGAPVKKKGIGCLGAIGVIFVFLVIISILGSLGHKSSTNNITTVTPEIKLDIVKGWEWTSEGDWNHIRGSVKNIGEVPVGYFEVRAEYMNSKGSVVDTDYTNSGERLNPGAAKKFEITHRHSPEFKKVSISIGRVSKAN